MTDTRLAVGFANYPGDVTANVLSEGPKGPNTFGELLYPVSAEYDPEVDKTRVGFSYQAPREA